MPNIDIWQAHLGAKGGYLQKQQPPKGLYENARVGIVSHVTVIDSEHQRASFAGFVIKTEGFNAEYCANQIVNYLALHVKLVHKG